MIRIVSKGCFVLAFLLVAEKESAVFSKNGSIE